MHALQVQKVLRGLFRCGKSATVWGVNMKHKTITYLRENVKNVLKRGRPKQLKKLKKAYHGNRLKKWWADYANADGCFSISELKGFENAGHRMKGGHRHNHIYNVCNRIVFRGKSARHVGHDEKKHFVEIFWANIRLRPDELEKILTKRKR